MRKASCPRCHSPLSFTLSIPVGNTGGDFRGAIQIVLQMADLLNELYKKDFVKFESLPSEERGGDLIIEASKRSRSDILEEILKKAPILTRPKISSRP